MNNHKDDGTFLTGVIMTVLMMASAIGGYWVRDVGIRFSVDQVKPTTHQEVRK